MKSSVLFAMVAGANAGSGTETQCFGGKAHTVTYDIDGDSLETLQNAKVDIAPEPAMNGYCTGREGDRDFCVGGNTDDCHTRRTSLPIDDIFNCDSCFAGLETDLYYSLEIKWLKLHKVELGLRDSHLRGALEVHGHKDVATGPLKTGSISLLDGAKTAQVKFYIAGIIPFDLHVSMPTTLEYSLGLHGSLDVLAGADLDIDLGDHFVTYEKDNGFSLHNTSMSVDLTPKLTLNSGTAAADVELKVRSAIQVDLDSVMWYHLNVVPSIPSTLSFEHTAGESDKICLRGDVDVPLSHEADVHFSLLGHDHDIYHYGPEELLHFRKEEAIDWCIDVPFADAVV
jgi:hypothetical protein